MNKDSEGLFRKTMEDVKKQMDLIDEQVEAELQKVREKLADLQEEKKNLRMVYEGTAKILGIEIEGENEDKAETNTSRMSKV
jgi:uncharacterized protein YoxC